MSMDDDAENQPIDRIEQNVECVIDSKSIHSLSTVVFLSLPQLICLFFLFLFNRQSPNISPCTCFCVVLGTCVYVCVILLLLCVSLVSLVSTSSLNHHCLLFVAATKTNPKPKPNIYDGMIGRYFVQC